MSSQRRAHVEVPKPYEVLCIVDADRAQGSRDVGAKIGEPGISSCALLEREAKISRRIVEHGVASFDLIGEGSEMRVDEGEEAVLESKADGDGALVGHQTHDTGGERVGADRGDVLGRLLPYIDDHESADELPRVELGKRVSLAALNRLAGSPHLLILYCTPSQSLLNSFPPLIFARGRVANHRLGGEVELLEAELRISERTLSSR